VGVSIEEKKKKDSTTSPHMDDTWPAHTTTKSLRLILGGCGGMLELVSSMNERLSVGSCSNSSQQ
jgi:hypothetical protein